MICVLRHANVYYYYRDNLKEDFVLPQVNYTQISLQMIYDMSAMKAIYFMVICKQRFLMHT